MSADHWQRLNELFHAALDLQPDARASYVARACDGDPALRDELLHLIEAHERSGEFLAADALDHLPSGDDHSLRDLRPDEHRIGPYRITTEIGRGGMGAVLLAERDDGQFEQRAAIKIIKRGMDSAMVLERFRVERQILSSLNHPNIARLLDGGTTASGLPYFVMEYIDGLPIDRYADEKRLSLRARLELFLHVCDAVSYAHQHLIVHRDIKPQNILVTGDGVPKLLDFGIAKVLQDAGEGGTLTIAGSQLLTPEYASPEQVDGRGTTTQTDVYSLGVVLYELLTGRSPYRPRTWTPAEVCAFVRSSPVERPSTAVMRRPAPSSPRRRAGAVDAAAAISAGSVERLQVQLKGDLDAIVLSALRKEPERRYPSVEALAADIRRHLNGLPVRARADSVWYRGSKFVARNRLAVAAGLLLTLALAGGAIATAWQAREARTQARIAQQAQARAERRFAEVRKVANALLFDYHDAVKDLPGATEIRVRLVRDALQYLNGLAADASGDASLQRELALAYRRVAEVQGGRAGASLGDTDGAIRSHRKSLEILESLAAANPKDAQAQWDVASGALRLANLISEAGDLTEALAHASRARAVYEPIAAATALSLDQRLAITEAYDVNGVLLLEAGRAAEALDVHRRQVQLLEAASASEGRDPRLRRALSVAYQHAADAEATFGDLQGALDGIRRSLQLRTALAAEYPLNVDYRRLVAGGTYYEADTLARLGRDREALEAYQRHLAIAEEVAAADSTADVGDLAFGLVRVGNMLARLGDDAQALRYYRRARSYRAAQMNEDAGNLLTRAALIEIEASLCASLVALARDAEGAAACARTVELIEGTTIEPTHAWIRAAVARSYSGMGDAYAKAAAAGRIPPERRLAAWRSAREMYERSVAIWSDMAARSMLTSHDHEEAAIVSKSLEASESALRRLAANQRLARSAPAAARR